MYLYLVYLYLALMNLEILINNNRVIVTMLDKLSLINNNIISIKDKQIKILFIISYNFLFKLSSLSVKHITS